MKKQIRSTIICFALFLGMLSNCSVAMALDDSKVAMISSGMNHTMVLKTDGSLWAFGSNWLGQLGDGTTSDRKIPIQVMSDINAVTASRFHHTMAIKTDGSLWSWGWNANGQLGDGTTINRSNPMKVMTDVIAVSAGEDHTMALKTDRSLWSLGGNVYGQLGDGTTNNRSNPTKIMTDVAVVSAGVYHTLALKTDGTLWSWGNNEHGQLGDGTTTNSSIPVMVMSDVASVSAGGNHTMVLKKDGTLWTFGYNVNGELGDGTTTNRSTPVKIMTDVAEISAGGYHSMILKTNGTLWTFGYNLFGELGDGTTTNRSTPVKVMTDVAEISAGGYHSMIFKTDGTLWTWGSNSYGQLGDGTNTNRSTPIIIKINNRPVSFVSNIDYTKSSNIRVIEDENQIKFDVNPQIINGRTLVPMRAIFEAIGLTVEWDNSSQIAKGTNEENSIIFTIGNNKALVNHQEKNLDVPASIIEGRTMVPLRFLSENMGYNVVWIGDSNLILISKNDIVEWRYGGYETIEPYREYSIKYVNGVKTSETRYTGKTHDVLTEWRFEGYELTYPYKEYERKYLNGVKTSETRYTGKTKSEEKNDYDESESITYKKVDYSWEYPLGLLTWDYSLKIPEKAVKIYKSIDRRYITGYSFYVTQDSDDEYMKSLANVFINTAKKEGYSDWDTINLAVSFVQSLKYVPDKIGTGYDEYPKFPLETLYDQGGDCEDTSILLASILRELGYGTVLVMTDDHMGVGIKTSEAGNFQFQGMNFYYIETTSPGWRIGELPSEIDGAKITILPVN